VLRTQTSALPGDGQLSKFSLIPFVSKPPHFADLVRFS
jgi:hypothetical protein